MRTFEGMSNACAHKPLMSVYQSHVNVDELHARVEHRRGQWIHLTVVPRSSDEHQRKNDVDRSDRPGRMEDSARLTFRLCGHRRSLVDDGQWRDVSTDSVSVSFCSPQETGTASGNALGWGFLSSPDHPVDQREDDGRSLTFDSSPLAQPTGSSLHQTRPSSDLTRRSRHLQDLLGFPWVSLDVSCNQPNGFLCARLCSIDRATGASILLSRGVLNLTHRRSHEHPQPLQVDQLYRCAFTAKEKRKRCFDFDACRLALK
jgi:predicted acyl esterase